MAPVFRSACVGCHYGAPEGLPLLGDEVYGLLVNHPSAQVPSMDRVEPGALERSYLWLKLEGTHPDVGGSGDPMPGSTYPALTDAELNLIEAWIVGGALP